MLCRRVRFHNESHSSLWEDEFDFFVKINLNLLQIILMLLANSLEHIEIVKLAVTSRNIVERL